MTHPFSVDAERRRSLASPGAMTALGAMALGSCIAAVGALAICATEPQATPTERLRLALLERSAPPVPPLELPLSAATTPQAAQSAPAPRVPSPPPDKTSIQQQVADHVAPRGDVLPGTALSFAPTAPRAHDPRLDMLPAASAAARAPGPRHEAPPPVSASAPPTPAALATSPTALVTPRLQPFAGIWAPSENACTPRLNRKGLLPAVISPDGAYAGETSCAFTGGRQVGPNAWTFAAACSDARRRWKAQVRLVVQGDRLVWSSRKGTQSYVRCGGRGEILRAEGAPRRPGERA